MADSFSEVTSESWFGRLWDSIKSVIVGIVLFLASFVLLFWNEGRAVHTAQSLAEGASVVASVPADTVNAANDGKLVHVTGEATTTEKLADSDFGVTAPAIKLDRQVQMFQWTEKKSSETKKKLGGGTETVTTYNYAQAWSPALVDSTKFKVPEGHVNPTTMPVEAMSWTAKKVTVGAFTLADSQVAMLDKKEPLAIDDTMAQGLSDTFKNKAKLDKGGYYFGADPATPALGDTKVSFQVVKPATVSLIARQVANSFEPYQAKAGNRLNMLSYGTVAADSMFKSAEEANTVLTWILRAVGFVAMALGLFLILRPIAVLGDVVPFIGSALAGGIGLVCFLLAACLSLFTIAVGWIAYRPVVGIGLMVLACAAIYGVVHVARKSKSAPPKASAAGA